MSEPIKVDVENLHGAGLDWAVAKCNGLELHKDALLNGVVMEGWWVSGYYMDPNQWIRLSQLRYSEDWSQSGAIIEREKITVGPQENHWWAACAYVNDDEAEGYTGATPLMAAMHCYVVKKMGPTIEIPAELLPEIEATPKRMKP